MINSELLKEKYRVQKRLSEESSTIKEYLKQAQSAAKDIAKSHGISLQYTEMSNTSLHSDEPAA